MPFRRLSLLAIVFLFLQPAARAQSVAPTVAPASAPTSVPPLVPYSGIALSGDGKPLAGDRIVTFLIYKEESGGEPLWAESQMVAVDSSGHYQAHLGAASSNGLPSDLFTTGEARWLEVQIAGQAAQSRTLLASVPYALKAGDATTLGGLPASAFALAGSKTAPGIAMAAEAAPNASSTVTTPGGTAGQLAKFSDASTVVSSIMTDTGTRVGIGTSGPDETLDVNGATLFRGNAILNRTQDATTANGGASSYPLVFTTGAIDSTTKTQIRPLFLLQAEPTGNNTATPSSTLNLLFNNGSATAETGLHFNANGTINFAPGQTFPGTGNGNGTITGVSAGTALTGGGNSGVVTLNVDSTKVPLLAANNAFTGNQTITGSLSAGSLAVAGTVSAGTFNAASGFDLGGVPFAFGSLTNKSVYFGLAGNSFTSGAQNTAVGDLGLLNNTSGSGNTAVGSYSLYYNTTGAGNIAYGGASLFGNTTGNGNTAIGAAALYFNTTGTFNVGIGEDAGRTVDGSFLTGLYNTALGFDTGFGTGSITNATAIGASAVATQSNTMVLGCIAGAYNCEATPNVGIGTTTPDSLLTVNGSADKPGGGSWGTYSDMRLKNVNGSFGGGLDQVMQLRPIRYRYKADNALGIRDADEHIGVVAQEVQRVIPEAVTENSKGYLLVNNDPILWSMVNAIQQQQKEIGEQQKEIETQRKLVQDQSLASMTQAARQEREIAAQQRLIRAQSQLMKSLATEVRETRKALRRVKEQKNQTQPILMAER